MNFVTIKEHTFNNNCKNVYVNQNRHLNKLYISVVLVSAFVDYTLLFI